jgi:hypothetical protein
MSACFLERRMFLHRKKRVEANFIPAKGVVFPCARSERGTIQTNCVLFTILYDLDPYGSGAVTLHIAGADLFGGELVASLGVEVSGPGYAHFPVGYPRAILRNRSHPLPYRRR